MQPLWVSSCIRAEVNRAPATVLRSAELKPNGRAAKLAFTWVQLPAWISSRRSGNLPRRRGGTSKGGDQERGRSAGKRISPFGP
eukprot:1671980-Pyramimonas_sp.AAC.1